VTYRVFATFLSIGFVLKHSNETLSTQTFNILNILNMPYIL